MNIDPLEVHERRERSIRPPDVVQDGGDLYWYRDELTTHPATGDVVPMRRRVCEDCWATMPDYVNNPGGFVSPESDVEIPSRKTRNVTLGSRASDGTAMVGVETRPRAVCHRCYLDGFVRVYGCEPPQPVCSEVR